jgi:predicted glutamine amidotransferase
MCRLLGFSSKNSSSLPQLLGQDLDKFVALSSIHCDGWGYAHVEHSSHHAEKFREPIPAIDSAHLKEELDTPTDGALLHFRWASKGLDVKESNTHPFTHEGITFIHNGSFRPFDVLKPYISEEYLALAQGDTDSELYFLYLLTEIKKHGFLQGITSALRFIKENIDHSSANMMIMNKDFFVTACRYNQDRIPDLFKKDIDYYELRYKEVDGSVLVASSGWNQEGWTMLPNDSLLIVDRSDQSHSTLAI